MPTNIEDGQLTFSTNAYGLTFPVDRPFVYLDDVNGHRLAELFILSSIHPMHDRDDTVRVGKWQVDDSGEETIFSLQADSSVWETKTYRLRCHSDRFLYEVEVTGSGRLAEACYFGGYYSGQPRWGSGFFRSGQSFLNGFNPEPNCDEVNHFSPAEGSLIDLMGVPLPGKASWFFTPPPFFFAFQGADGWLGMGVEARPGWNRFTEYCYHGQMNAFHLTLSYEGHTAVDGLYRLPAIAFDFGPHEHDALMAHVRALHAIDGAGPRAKQQKPDWWHEPIFCGWGAQCYTAATEAGWAPDYSRQTLYESIMRTLDENVISPGIVVIDDKWQATYGENRADEAKWPDLRGFVEQHHHVGKKVLLWLKAWDPEGVPAAECITNAAGLPLAVDPTNPAFQERLRESIRTMLAPDGYDADGLKIDFSARIPSGPGIRIHGDSWGLELMKLYLGIIYDEAKRVKGDALIIAHTPHPYLANVLDMIRLNDINSCTDVTKAMTFRAMVAQAACPGALIDTDNWPMGSRAAWREYLQLQPLLGVPSLYYASHIDSTGEPLEPNDYQMIRDVWAKYRLRWIKET